MFDPVIILCALLCGLLAHSLRLPALVGYLLAGFTLYEFGARESDILTTLADVGVTLLLFCIGLKLRPKELMKTKIWGTAVVHMGLSILAFAPLVFLLVSSLSSAITLEWKQAVIIAFALSFSSTVFAIQILQERGEMASRHASLAIGILLMQDIAAVVYLGASTGKLPELSALLLLLLIPARSMILRLLKLSGHGELFTLAGLALAILGAQVFELVGIKGDLGALILGVLLAGDQKAKELAKNLLQFKDLFLVGFFVSIGLSGWPSAELIIIAVIIGVLAPLKAPLYFWLMTKFHATPRDGLLSSAALSNHSEFGLIVIAIAVSSGSVDAQWAATLSLAVAISFLLSSGANIRIHGLYARWASRLARFSSEKLTQKQPDTSGIRAIILGMGNIGTGAYDAMRERHGDSVVGIDENEVKLARHLGLGRRVLDADASDPNFWSLIDLHELEQVMLALTNHQENMLVGKQLRTMGYTGAITAIVRFDEEDEELKQYNIDSFNLFNEAGRGFAEHADKLKEQPVPAQNAAT